MSVNSGFQKLKIFFSEKVRILLRQPRPKPIKFKEYQFQGAKLVASPGRPRVSGRSWIPANACILVIPVALMWLTLRPPQGPKVILDILCRIFFPSHDCTRLSASFRAFWRVLLCCRGSGYRRFEDRVALIFRVTQSKKSAAWTRQWRHYGPSTGPATRYHYIPENLIYSVCITNALSSGLMYTHEIQRTGVWCTCTEVTWPDMMVQAQRTLAANDTTCVTQHLSVSCIINSWTQ
jgi:hypothetical protein